MKYIGEEVSWMKLANVPITMLGGDLRELELAKTLLDYEVDLRLVDSCQ